MINCILDHAEIKTKSQNSVNNYVCHKVCCHCKAILKKKKGWKKNMMHSPFMSCSTIPLDGPGANGILYTKTQLQGPHGAPWQAQVTQSTTRHKGHRFQGF